MNNKNNTKNNNINYTRQHNEYNGPRRKNKQIFSIRPYMIILFYTIIYFSSSSCIRTIEARSYLPALPPSSTVSYSYYWSSEISSSVDRVENRNVYSQHQCSCPNCECNNQQLPCPRTLSSNEYTLLASLETCGKFSQVVSVGIVNIQSKDESSLFKYYLVDEDNKKKALKGNAFEYSTLKSGGTDSYSCVYDTKPPVRFPKDGGRAYLIAKSTGNSTSVRFNIQMSCVVPPFSSVEIASTKFGDWTKFYAGNPITYTLAFKNRFSLVDTWIQGSLYVTNLRNQPEVPVVDGLGVVKFTPVGSGVVTLTFKFVPSPAMYGSIISDLTAPSALVVKMASRGSFDVTPSTVIVNSEFKIKYTIYDNDGTITPVLDLKKLAFSSPDVDLNCTSPKDSYGSGSVLCIASSTSTGAQFAIMMDNYIVISKTIPVVENESFWINVAVVALCVFIVAVILVLTVIGFVLWRRTHQHTKLIDEKFEVGFDEIIVDIDSDDSEHQHSQ